MFAVALAASVGTAFVVWEQWWLLRLNLTAVERQKNLSSGRPMYESRWHCGCARANLESVLGKPWWSGILCWWKLKWTPVDGNDKLTSGLTSGKNDQNHDAAWSMHSKKAS